MSLNAKLSSAQDNKRQENASPPRTKSNPISDLILSKNLSDAYSMMNTNPEFLGQPGLRGRYPIHMAAISKDKDLFEAMLEKGVNPFQCDADGYSAYYHALIHRSTDIVALCLSFFPNQNWMSKEDGIFDELLVKAGFHPYVISPFKSSEFPETDDPAEQYDNDINQMHSFLQQLLFAGSLPGYISKVKKSKSKTKSKEEDLLLIDPLFLQKIAYGFVDSKIEPAQIVKLITDHYQVLNNLQKLACVYLLKEFIKADVAHEFCEKPEFKAAMRAFIKGMDNGNVLALAAVKNEFDRFYANFLPQDHLASPESLAFDLAKIFHEPFTQLTPINFTVKMLAKKNLDKNPAFAKLSALSNNIAHLVSVDILSAKTNSDKRRLIKYYLEVIAICLKKGKYQSNENYVYNYAAACAILNGLDTTQVSRLKKVWDPLLKDVTIQRQLEEFKVLFNPEKAFATLRREMAEHPQCIPLLAIYCAEKDKNAEADLHFALELNGSSNMRFAQHVSYLRQLGGFQQQRFKTDLSSKLESLFYNDDYCWALSYQIDPPKVIKLDANLDIATILSLLDTMQIQKAPLVVKQKDKKYYATEAYAKLNAYLDAKFPKVLSFDGTVNEQAQQRQQILDKAAIIIKTFDNLIKRPVNELIDTTTQALDALSLGNQVTRKRSKTAAHFEIPEISDEDFDKPRSNTIVEIQQEQKKHKRSKTSTALLGSRAIVDSIDLGNKDGEQDDPLAQFKHYTPGAESKVRKGKPSRRLTEENKKQTKSGTSPKPGSSTNTDY